MFIPFFSLVVAKLSLLKAIGLKGAFLKPIAFHPGFYPNPGMIHAGFFYHPAGYWVPIHHTILGITHNEVVMSLLMGYAPDKRLAL